MPILPHRFAVLAAGPLLLLTSSGCFDVHRGKAQTAENIEKTDVLATPSGAFVASMKSDGSLLNVNVDAHCSLVEQQTVKITTSYKKEFDDGASTLLAIMGITGTGTIATGVGLLADSPKVYQADPHSRLYNPTGKDTVVGIGIALSVIGAAIVTLPIANGIHLAGSDNDESTTTRAGKTIKRDTPCDGSVALPAHSVIAKTDQGQTVAVGSTDGSGHMSASLKQILGQPGAFGGGPLPISLGIYVDNQFVGEVATGAALREVQADKTAADDGQWTAAGADVCAREHSDAACIHVKQYRDMALAAQIGGAHLTAAEDLLAKVSRGPVVAADATGPTLVLSAVAAAQAASAAAQQRVLDAADAAEKKLLLKAQEDAARAGKSACTGACKDVCDGPVKTGKETPGEAATCRATCQKEACP
jgi:hypothetical protein